MAKERTARNATAGDQQGMSEAQDSKVNAANVDLGNVDVSQLAALGFDEVDPLKGLDAAYNAGQEGFLPGVTKLGLYLGTKTCVSTKEKKPNWKDHPEIEGKVIRRLHHFQVAKVDGEVTKQTYGIWSAGCLDAMLRRIRPQTVLAITYIGQADKAFKQGQTPPHMFTLRGKGIDLKITDLDAFESDVAGDEELGGGEAQAS